MPAWLAVSSSDLVAILGMALATYACRGGGYWLFRQIRPTPQKVSSSQDVLQKTSS